MRSQAPHRRARQPATLWPPARKKMAVCAMLAAAVTAGAAAALNHRPAVSLASGSATTITDQIVLNTAAGAYFVLAVIALSKPGAITVKVILGLVLVGNGLFDYEGLAMLVMLPVLGGVVVTTELLGIVGKLEMVVERHPAPDLSRLGWAAGLTAISYGFVLLVGQISGPSGLVAAALAAGACLALGLVLGSP